MRETKEIQLKATEELSGDTHTVCGCLLCIGCSRETSLYVACLEAGRHRRGSTVEQVHASTQRSKTGDGKKKKKSVAVSHV